jgi:integrase
MKRRAKGTGSVSERPDGKADAEFKFREWDGTLMRCRKRLPSKEAAERWLVRVRYEHERQMLPSAEAERLTLGDYLVSWLSDIEGTVSRHTLRDYADKVRLHIAPALGNTRLRELTTGHLQKLYRRKLSEGLSPRSVRYIHVTLSKALHDAAGRDLVRKNVAKFAKPPKDEHSEKPVISVADAVLFLEAIRGDRFEALYLLAVTTGLRRGELLGLKWVDVDLDAGTLKVSRSLDSLYGPHQEVAPKRQASRGDGLNVLSTRQTPQPSADRQHSSRSSGPWPEPLGSSGMPRQLRRHRRNCKLPSAEYRCSVGELVEAVR